MIVKKININFFLYNNLHFDMYSIFAKNLLQNLANFIDSLKCISNATYSP